MDTSKSAEPAFAGVDVFSGRPNPRWPLPSAELDRIEAVWQRLPARSDVASNAATLGYRGCFVEVGERRWTIAGDHVTLERGGRKESRSDLARDIERIVLDSAPTEIAALLASAAIPK